MDAYVVLAILAVVAFVVTTVVYIITAREVRVQLPMGMSIVTTH